MTVPRTCPACRAKPVATNQRRYCYDCTPGGPQVPPPCRKCGSERDFYAAGLCRRCHRFAPHVIDSCRDCLGWGVTRHTTWLCEACRGWRRKISRGDGPCRICRTHRPLNGEALCRLCRRQAALARSARRGTTAEEANRHGQQLFIVDTFRQRRSGQRLAPPELGAIEIVGHRQLTLFTISRTEPTGLAYEEADPELVAAVMAAAEHHATNHGWKKTQLVNARRVLRILLGRQDTPGAPIPASDVLELNRTDKLAAQPALDVLDAIGMLEDDREPSVTAWFDAKLAEADLPEPMVTELRAWFTVMKDGTTRPPRRRPRSHITIRVHAMWALPVLKTWAAVGTNSLREISSADVRAALPKSGSPRSTTGQGLRSIFKVLKGQKIIFTDPTARIRTGSHETRDPLPLTNLEELSHALNSTDPARAALTALFAFHGLRNHQLRDLLLTDKDGPRLRVGDRTILLAAPVRERLTSWLDHRTARWPNSSNPYVFINAYTANRSRPVSGAYFSALIRINTQAIREDRILHEAIATEGDIRRLCDLFGLSVAGAERYATVVGGELASADDR
ncbi:hypothetical protein [Nonomuraea soli]|uniref:Uncharacterized protein n=1 Tax=Nonomuraea soli TaxID=1032476 RepID=A0A7W0CUU9_9ACTN|nr:hypothetical protein [Nonomuraea soli]MBA2897769.1 hypothetical protein [Nonomuraea soli]